MSKSKSAVRRIRKSFGKIAEVAPIPNLIEVQKKSYEAFLQFRVPREERKNQGLEDVLRSIFPIKDFAGLCELEYVRYDFDNPKYDIDECRQRGLTFSAPLRVSLRLIVWEVDQETGAKSVRDVKEQDVYMGDMPLMTEDGTFIINGTERVIVSQMHRSPGVFFDHDGGKTHASGKILFSARVIPYRGSWIDLEFDPKDLLYVRIDRRRKILASSLLMALDSDVTEVARAKAIADGKDFPLDEAHGMGREEILKTFYGVMTYSRLKKGQWKCPLNPGRFKGIKIAKDIVDAKTGDVVIEAGSKMTPRQLQVLEAEKDREIVAHEEDMLGSYISSDLFNSDTGEVILEAGDEITLEALEMINTLGIKSLPVLEIDHVKGPYLRNTLLADKNKTRMEALVDIYRILRPGEPPTLEGADVLFSGLFFNEEKYDLSPVGRIKMNARLGFESSDEPGILRKKDIIEILRVLIDLKDGKGEIDDIDHLGNRRVRSVGELLENQYRLGLLRMERSIRERMGAVEMETVMPHDLINAKPASAAVREFFTSSQLSQFMDQTNPLSEITHKRRLSALGPGGLTRDRACFEVRDVHPTHYGRICPIETPEGQNIGLINSLATYARINKYGFIETPYRKVSEGKISSDVTYLSAIDEGKYTVAQADADIDAEGNFLQDFVNSRVKGEFVPMPSAQIDFVDVSPKQLVSVAASLIPFLENDDANRALMGSNMQRQAVPLLRTEAPIVGTGMERNVARDSGVTVIARRSGIVDQVDAQRIVVKATDLQAVKEQGVDIYTLKKFQRSNQNTCINQRPLVKVGEAVSAGDVIADGPSTDKGELALGRNALVAFMSWNGYNFEDSIMISERIVKDDVFTSIHIEEFDIMSRDTKLGAEDITRDIPSVGEESLKNLDETGIVYVGAEVNPGDILVGKVTPKGETPVTPEEKLLRAIFGEKASDVRDSSLRLPPGTSGTVVDVRVFSRRGIEKDERALAIERAEISRLAKDRDSEKTILERSYYGRLKELLMDRKIVKGPKGLKAGGMVTRDVLAEYTRGQWRQIVVDNKDIMDTLESVGQQFDQSVGSVNARFEDKADKVRRGDEMLPGVLKTVKVFVAVKRKLQPGDKMAGRHGNKGVISRITPIEDMPRLEDGTPVDIVLNPLGIPSRMNIGQILETHLGWASAGLGKKVHKILKDIRQGDVKVKDARSDLKTIYGNDESKEIIDSLDDNQLVDVLADVGVGIPMATPVFDGASVEDVTEQLGFAGIDLSGQETLYDGRTGEAFARKSTVGYMYMLKLDHLVDDKIHARSIGPYSLVTQQPLGGKAQFGGQRFGEMEVWALQAYGAAYTLQEILTFKSDDVAGRTKAYEAMIRGDNNFESGIPESFNVLVKEIKSLGMNVELKGEDRS
ncbi:DNA-directed RNA polymerase subunit beta [Alphaproteobacteria bacterium]|nr:DNA-directed RNA polymerase subunit beta [Alphaproteobacteria bacterium]